MEDTKKVCPECGQVLEGLSIEGHSLQHWPDHLDPAKSSKEARKRQAELNKGGISLATYKARLNEGG